MTSGFTIEKPILRASGSGRIRESDAAIYLGCSTRWLRKNRASDSGPNFDLIAGRVWYQISALDDYLAACAHETTR